MQAIDEIVPTLLHALDDDQISDTALDGLKQILRLKTVCSVFSLGALAEVAGPALPTAMGYTDMEVQSLAKKAAETVVTVIDEEGIEFLLSEVLKGVGDIQDLIRQSSAYLE
ncbi:PREDICTED: eIF-2-alpha kinase activator GCN1-like [Ipomoea nil]|uniref:eIF-2-alpha kinase activator GCN1-like n=1 Tax=Ipomoea nil TaxID=35883 RepID=UPI00090146DB|nr:PREDICTED: eIF-2-alpha kinase activator GCN1-like [Ipomoea nil]